MPPQSHWKNENEKRKRCQHDPLAIPRAALPSNRRASKRNRFCTRSLVPNAIKCSKPDRKCSATNGYIERRRSRARFAPPVFCCKVNWIAIGWANMPSKRNICAPSVERVSPVDRACGSIIDLMMTAKRCRSHAQNVRNTFLVDRDYWFIWGRIRARNHTHARKSLQSMATVYYIMPNICFLAIRKNFNISSTFLSQTDFARSPFVMEAPCENISGSIPANVRTNVHCAHLGSIRKW